MANVPGTPPRKALEGPLELSERPRKPPPRPPGGPPERRPGALRYRRECLTGGGRDSLPGVRAPILMEVSPGVPKAPSGRLPGRAPRTPPKGPLNAPYTISGEVPRRERSMYPTRRSYPYVRGAAPRSTPRTPRGAPLGPPHDARRRPRKAAVETAYPALVLPYRVGPPRKSPPPASGESPEGNGRIGLPGVQARPLRAPPRPVPRNVPREGPGR